MKISYKLALCVAAAIALAGCSSPKYKTSGMPGSNGVETNGIGGVNSFGGQGGSDGGLSSLSSQDQAQLAALGKVIYFAFDKNDLDAQATTVAQANATFLLQHPALHLLLAGNTDPRGSQEYNFHLGQRRADAVKDYFLQQGVAANQLCTVSYGELKPATVPDANSGNWQDAYRLDRRVDLEYGQTCAGQDSGSGSAQTSMSATGTAAAASANGGMSNTSSVQGAF